MTMLIAALLAAATLQPTEPPPVMVSTTNAPHSCPPAVLGRTEDGAELQISMEQYSSYSGPFIVLHLNRTPAEFRTTLIRIGSRNFADGVPLTSPAIGAINAQAGQTMRLRRPGLEALGSATMVHLVDRDTARLTFPVDRDAVSSLRTCVDAFPPSSSEMPDDALSNGFYYVQLPPNRPVGTGRIPRLTYPITALREDREGDTLVHVIVLPNGTAVDCSIVSSSGWPDLDQAACDATRRIRFRVATDANAEPVQATAHIPFAWRINS
ncbi:energy transducer TonB [Sphingomonas lacunae]|uniref:Energy transducer TonB n=1 Tax=Sphingomonas lacunae TaxID=2698828 RepID=A0A6M4ATN8_9SPHN|nr:energy transducer TonB [Sphingomonas lacunae]QJQ32477.1 energy transducer TonB [Sphingomonas lacunae]